MKEEALPAAIKGVLPTSNSFIIFLGTEEKTFTIHVDQAIGAAISMAMKGERRERPGTHDLIADIFEGIGVGVQRVVINDVNDNTYYARIILRMENELGSKLLELDARPSDSMVLALQAKKPILVSRKVLDKVDDMSEILEKILKQQI